MDVETGDCGFARGGRYTDRLTDRQTGRQADDRKSVCLSVCLFGPSALPVAGKRGLLEMEKALEEAEQLLI